MGAAFDLGTDNPPSARGFLSGSPPIGLYFISGIKSVEEIKRILSTVMFSTQIIAIFVDLDGK